MNTISPEVKTALVTGTDHGVGFSLAKKLLARGYFVIAVRIDETEKQIDALQSLYPNQKFQNKLYNLLKLFSHKAYFLRKAQAPYSKMVQIYFE